MDVLQQLLGRLHPLIVHLPIGFILLGLLLQWHDRKTRQYGKVIGLIFLWAGISAVLACSTGYLQYLGEGYGFDTVKLHLWSGIATALFSFIMYARLRKWKPADFLAKIPMVAFSILLFVMISFTGHQGGNITHGEDYLVEPLPNSIKSALGYATFEEKKIVLNEQNWDEAQLYEEVIDPILNNKCISCHNPKKTKGELLLNSEEGILTGGENGEVVVTNSASDSEIFIRMNLPKDNDDHMPPEGKTQPSKEEIALIGAWLDAGHPFGGTIAESGLGKELFRPFFPKKVDNDYPNLDIVAASQDSIDAIKDQGIHIDKISTAVNFLKVSCLNKPSFSDSDFVLLNSLKKQIAVLDLGGTRVSDAIFEKLATLPHLTILNLDDTDITGKGIEKLADASEHLKSINLTNSKFQEPYLEKLADFKKLKKVYVFNSQLDADGTKSLKDGQITIDYGNYELPAIASDSIVY
ncbi:Uncharacterized membrane protein [Pricia antarctica]|uniref:Uncharacterized membrane protein n=1 Tax=Pricia antarctica TaxID=641691 RepID=A0A1G7FEC7_9FLAO|nr:c-type cytochrome domain-containing protein [Pricia antarctica]SDE74224.1 Uncharacterized membrane protein [Pricia antarctica]